MATTSLGPNLRVALRFVKPIELGDVPVGADQRLPPAPFPRSDGRLADPAARGTVGALPTPRVEVGFPGFSDGGWGGLNT